MVEYAELLKKVQVDYPELRIRVGKKFMYRPPRTVFVERRVAVMPKSDQDLVQVAQDSLGVPENEQNNYCLQLLHELGHALLRHETYEADAERIKIERAAWDKARELCAIYGVCYDKEFVENELDSYRGWLHQRSVCSGCGMVRYQDRKGVYHCPFCENMGIVEKDF